jgi:hypothetical protein
MFVAAWSLDIQFGSRQEALRALREFQPKPEDGWRAKRTRVLMGSIGAPESRLVLEHDFASLADLEASWSDLQKRADRFQQWLQAMKPHIVPGSTRWEIYRVIEEG